MALKLGTKPESLQVLLNPGSDFLLTLRPRTDSGVVWADDVHLELTIGEITWTANVSSNAATFIIDQDEVDRVLVQDDLSARLWYVQTGVPAQTGSEDSSGQEIRLIMAKGQAINNG